MTCVWLTHGQIAKTAVEGSIQTIRKIFNGEMDMD
jgi:hypothetical protein